MTAVLLAPAGLTLLGLSLLARLGRSPLWRSWADGSWADVSVVLLVLPGLGLLLAGGALRGAAAGTALELWLAVPVLVGIVLCGWGLLALPTPAWFSPSWLRARRGGWRG